ncbi:phosphatase PAP2 family protein [Aurantiacibacter spongiae]|uniref:Inositolphosphotransferase Aur1/Ipt1 domain-containing protein n=1 Tax=Aurantiacibacter spongiae TaxID=2488860 RepID=A0A3N5CU32_9SPHN|nr:phosphatase PAP2 family protein [Aurantiacibacter spongiae]RPF71826.1 hypothetical protein EG799_09495 [Aurantiacibacter spongiae]
MIARLVIGWLLAAHLLLGMVLVRPDPVVLTEALRANLVILTFLALGAFAWLGVEVARQRPASPLRLMRDTLWARRHRYIEGTAFLLALALMMQAYMMLKVAIPRFVPFWADPLLADMDAALFGRDPWLITHAMFGDAATRFLDWFYVLPCLVVTLGMTVWACFAADRAFSRRAVLAIMASWFLIGNWAALVLSSAGPVYAAHFYGDPRFAALGDALPADLTAVQTQAYLLANFGQPGFGKGISAMPSMHNALYLLLIVMTHHRFGMGWRLWLAVAFEAVVFVASVHLGWHYALDGIVAAVLVMPVWLGAGWIVQAHPPVRRPSARSPLPA